MYKTTRNEIRYKAMKAFNDAEDLLRIFNQKMGRLHLVTIYIINVCKCMNVTKKKNGSLYMQKVLVKKSTSALLCIGDVTRDKDKMHRSGLETATTVICLSSIRVACI